MASHDPCYLAEMRPRPEFWLIVALFVGSVAVWVAITYHSPKVKLPCVQATSPRDQLFHHKHCP